uniref:Dynactin domain-containing protein n=1 Tax=Angiostrongylus cantonensis TaxID=6313 RepID=A0A158P9B3_ANGCA
MSNWCEDDTLDLTSDLSCVGDDGSEAAETSTTTVAPQNSLWDNVNTPTAPCVPDFVDFPSTVRHLSLSQPELPASSIPAPVISKLNFTLQYYSLQMSKFDMEEERKQIAEAKRQAQIELESAEMRAQQRVDDVEAKLRDAAQQKQALLHQCNQASTTKNAKAITEELRARLTALEKENNILRNKIEEDQKELNEKTVLGDTTSQSKSIYTFVVGGGCDVQALVRRIDELEANLHDEQEERTKSNTALVAYMSRCHELEKKIRNISTSYSNLSFSALGKDEVLKLVRKIRDLLLSLGKENKELRKECAKHLGLGELSQTTVDSNDVNEVTNAAGGLEKSALLKENFEQKQLEVFNMLQSLASNVSNLDESVVNILKSIDSSTVAYSEEQFSRVRGLEWVASPRLGEAIPTILYLIFLVCMSKSFIEDSDAGIRALKLGSGSDEMRHLAGRIRSMKFEWNNVIDESRVFLSVIEETSQSVSKMQHEISIWEQSLNETSFRLDCSMVHTRSSAQTASSDMARVELICCHDSKQMEMLLSTKEEEIVRLQSLVEKIHDDHEKVIASGDNLRDEVKQLEEALFDARKERDGLAATLESKEVEMRLLRASLEEQLSVSQQVQQDVLNLRHNTEALIREIGAKDIAIADVEAKLSVARERSEELKRALLERETEAKEIRAVLEEEQERGKTDREEWKIALMAAQETSSALRSDVERILNELSVKEDTIRHLNDQLQTAKENNLLMAEVVSEYASNESLDKHICKSHRPTVMANVQNLPQISTVKSRDSQTELTRAALVKMESDFLSHSSEIDMLRLAYDELSHAIGKLVVKDVEPLPNPVNISWIEESCKKLSRLIHHERRRRENQANEVAAMASKLEELKQQWRIFDYASISSRSVGCSSVSRTGDAFKEVCPAVHTDLIKQSAHQKMFDNPMRQTLFVLTTTAMDLVKLLRRLSSLHSTGHKVNFQDAIELARKLRNELNERFLIVRTEKENENKHCVTDLIHMVKILEKDNRILHDNIKTWRSEYEALSEKIANNPELVERIANQLRRIHTVMGESRRACGLLQESQARTNKPATEP